MSALDDLLVVQDHDTAADQLRHRRAHLPARSRLAEVGAELAEVEGRGAAATAERDELAGRQAALETELAEIDKRAADIDRQMRSGAISAARDLQAMVDQIDGLKRRKSNLEDTELEVMEALEPVESSVAELQARWAELDREAVELRAQVAEAEVSVDSELDVVLRDRSAAAAAVPSDLLATYERLRQRLGGVGAARLVGSSCGGCHLTLSASEVDRIRHLPADAIATCEQCGRILIR
ncbi:MAG: zinc ribbon domain-containing protein [Acidimicrobiales bacterium]